MRRGRRVVVVVVVGIVLGLYGHRRLDGDQGGLIHLRLLEQIENVENAIKSEYISFTFKLLMHLCTLDIKAA